MFVKSLCSINDKPVILAGNNTVCNGAPGAKVTVVKVLFKALNSCNLAEAAKETSRPKSVNLLKFALRSNGISASSKSDCAFNKLL